MFDVLGAVAAALLAFTAVPVVLVVVVGNPLSGGLGHAWQAASRDALFVVALAAWIAWAACCAQLVRAVVAHVRSGDVRGHGASVLDLVAARIAVGVLALSSVGGPAALSASAGASVPSVQTTCSHDALRAVRRTAPAGTGGDHSGHRRHDDQGAAADRAGTDATAARRPPVRHGIDLRAVQPGDTLWRIADDLLDDGADWTALAAINLGRDMGDGERFVDPDHIKTGWRLRLPERLAIVRRPDEGRGIARIRVPASFRRRRPRRARSSAGACSHSGWAPLPAPHWLGAARRRHRPEPFRDDLDLGRGRIRWCRRRRLSPEPLRRGAGAPGLRDRQLHAGPGADRRSLRPVVRAVQVGPRGVTFWLRGTARRGARWVRAGRRRRGMAGDPRPTRTVRPRGAVCPHRLPHRRRRRGHVARRPRPGPAFSLSSAPRPTRSNAPSGPRPGAWAWADTVVVTDDAGDPDIAVRGGGRPTARAARAVLRRPRRAATARRRAHGDRHHRRRRRASDLTILVDRHGATIHPLSRVVRPHLQSDDAARHIAELMAPASAPARAPAAVRREPVLPSARSARRHRSGRPGPGRRPPADHDTPPRRPVRAPACQPGAPRRRAGGLSGPAPARRHHQRPAPHPGARVVRRRCRRQDLVQHRVRRASGHGPRRRRRAVASGRPRARASTRCPRR